jgi:hypothetical protein
MYHSLMPHVVQIELEYNALEAALPLEQRRSQQQICEDAALAAQ